jgi:uncharacterized protein with ParB-like and HNH nuclease domain
MKELVFNIRNIFNLEHSEGCLGQYDAIKYHIPAYQRGYKWASTKQTDAIPVLLNDLWEAYKNSLTSSRKEYYMQYITVKKNATENHLEVIDGQQRLTSFSILLSVFQLFLDNQQNISKDKLEYAIREDFFNNYIYDKDKLQEFVNAEWDQDKGITIQNISINKQDIFYLHSAAKYMVKFLKEEVLETDLLQFYAFILKHVKIIVNEIEPHIESERVFKNLNSNKVGLTEAELIKGLLLTKAARSSSEHFKHKKYKEILEIRASLGRQWDEINTWVNDKKVKHFYFSNNNKNFNERNFIDLLKVELKDIKDLQKDKAILLLMLSMSFKKDTEIKDNQYLLFNYFHKETKDENASLQFLLKLKQIYSILKDRFQNNKIYNLLGYVFFVEGSNTAKIDYLCKSFYWSKEELLSELIKERNEFIPDDLEVLKYGEYNKEIHRVLLALSVFETTREKIEIRFDYYNFRKNNDWSLEHIFPQKPEGKWRGQIHKLTDQEKKDILDMIGEDYEDFTNVEKVLSLEERNDDQKELYYQALQKTWVNNLGNMSLLSPPENSSNGCAMFKQKRDNVNEKINCGSFVPKHTFEVFNKVFLKSESLTNWNKKDADNHLEYIKEIIKKLKQSTN